MLACGNDVNKDDEVGKLATVNALLGVGADITGKNFKGKTALGRATTNKFSVIAAALRAAGATE